MFVSTKENVPESLQNENESDLVVIKRYRINEKGHRGRTVSLPRVWLDDLALKPGDTLVLYRRAGSDDLIVRPDRKIKRGN